LLGFLGIIDENIFLIRVHAFFDIKFIAVIPPGTVELTKYINENT